MSTVKRLTMGDRAKLYRNVKGKKIEIRSLEKRSISKDLESDWSYESDPFSSDREQSQKNLKPISKTSKKIKKYHELIPKDMIEKRMLKELPATLRSSDGLLAAEVQRKFEGYLQSKGNRFYPNKVRRCLEMCLKSMKDEFVGVDFDVFRESLDGAISKIL